MQLSFEYDRTYFPAFPVFDLMVIGAQGRQSAQGLIDSGSDVTQLPLPLLQAVGAREVDERWVRDISGLRYPVAIYMLHMQIGEVRLSSVEVVGRGSTNEIIVGRDVLNQFIITLNGLANVTEIRDEGDGRYQSPA